MNNKSFPDGSTDPKQLCLPQFECPSGLRAFVTQEERASVALNSFAPFWRLGDPLCARVLAEGLDPRRFHLVKAIFPLFRAASVFRFPREPRILHAWQPFAFFAGLEYGRRFPTEAAALLADDPLQAAGALHGLRRLQDALGDREANPWHLFDAFGSLREQGCGVTDDPESALIQFTTETFCLGLAAATTARSEPELNGFLARIQPRATELRTQLQVRALFHSCARAWNRPIVELLQHPLITVAAEQYPSTPVEKATIMPFFHELLRFSGVRSENECPTDDFALVTCVERAWQWGKRLRQREPCKIKDVIADLGPSEFEAVAEVAQDVLRRAKSPRATDLTREIFRWHSAVYGWTQPCYYGQALGRLVHFADFAIWAAWVSKQ